MHHRSRGIAIMMALLTSASMALAVSACGGGSSSEATTLLQQTFAGAHKVTSGNLSFNLTIEPTGSSTLNGPLRLSFGGPFQGLGPGKLPQSNFTISLSGLGKTGSLGLLSTGDRGFVTLQGVNYQMPAATFQRLESSFAGLTSSSGAGAGTGTLAKLGIDPLRWLVHPSIAGSDNVGGAQTTHIRAGIDVAALLGDLNTFLQKAASRGGAAANRIPTSISPSTRARIASEVKNPSFDVWTGKSDKTARRLAVRLTLPVSGQTSTLLGGLRSAGISLSMEYANLNQAQSIAAPTSVRPFSEFTAKLTTLAQTLRSALGGIAGIGGGAGPSTGGAGGGATGAPVPPNLQRFTQCIQAAGTDAAKRQSCASLLQGK